MSSWRQIAQKTIAEVINASGHYPDGIAEMIKEIDAAYPFGERRYHPYKMWLKERRSAIRKLQNGTYIRTQDVRRMFV